jgi:hypothetical protein
MSPADPSRKVGEVVEAADQAKRVGLGQAAAMGDALVLIVADPMAPAGVAVEAAVVSSIRALRHLMAKADVLHQDPKAFRLHDWTTMKTDNLSFRCCNPVEQL